MDETCKDLKALIGAATTARSASMYESTFDEFIQTIGGTKVDVGSDPPGQRRADYFLKLAGISAIIELKQLFEQTPSLVQVATKLLRANKISSGFTRDLGGNVVGLTPGSMTRRDRYRLYAKWGRILDDKLRDANRQLKSSGQTLSQQDACLKGVIILNTGNYQFTTGRISNVVGVFLHKQWEMNHYQNIDFAAALTIDLFKEGPNPLNGGAIARPTKRSNCSPFLEEFLRQWTAYLACGLEKSFSFAIEYGQEAIVDDLPYIGKITRKF